MWILKEILSLAHENHGNWIGLEGKAPGFFSKSDKNENLKESFL